MPEDTPRIPGQGVQTAKSGPYIDIPASNSVWRIGTSREHGAPGKARAILFDGVHLAIRCDEVHQAVDGSNTSRNAFARSETPGEGTGAGGEGGEGIGGSIIAIAIFDAGNHIEEAIGIGSAGNPDQGRIPPDFPPGQ